MNNFHISKFFFIFFFNFFFISSSLSTLQRYIKKWEHQIFFIFFLDLVLFKNYGQICNFVIWNRQKNYIFLLNVILDLNKISTKIFRHSAFQYDKLGNPNNAGIVIFHIIMNTRTLININMTANANVIKVSTQLNLFMTILLILCPLHLMQCCLLM